jgi:serine/threonine protein kinase
MLQIYHRDLKAENVLIKVLPDNTLELRVADFGFARDALNMNVMSGVGTVLCAAPEVGLRFCTQTGLAAIPPGQALVAAPYCQHADHWSLGVLACVASCIPFACADQGARSYDLFTGGGWAFVPKSMHDAGQMSVDSCLMAIWKMHTQQPAFLAPAHIQSDSEIYSFLNNVLCWNAAQRMPCGTILAHPLIARCTRRPWFCANGSDLTSCAQTSCRGVCPSPDSSPRPIRSPPPQPPPLLLLLLPRPPLGLGLPLLWRSTSSHAGCRPRWRRCAMRLPTSCRMPRRRTARPWRLRSWRVRCCCWWVSRLVWVTCSSLALPPRTVRSARCNNL